jgi:hypothetical protein
MKLAYFRWTAGSKLDAEKNPSNWRIDDLLTNLEVKNNG